MYASRYMLPVEVGVLNQGGWGSCYPNALVSSIESMLRLGGYEVAPLSRLQSYYDTRDYQGTLSYDSGSVGYMALYAAITRGIAPESMWGYTSDHMYTQPTQAVYDEAFDVRVATYRSIYNYGTAELQRDTVLDYLSQGKSVIAGFYLRQYFYNEYGSLSTQASSGGGGTMGAHAVQIVGYDANINGGSYIVKNSWGTDWGDNGYGTVSYKQMATDFISMEVITGYRLNGKFVSFDFGSPEEHIAEQYAVILGRAAEQEGMNWWIDHNLSAVLTHGVFSDILINSAEGVSIYGGMSNDQFVQAAYHNTLGRAADASGLAFWSGALDRGYSRGFVIDELIEAVRSPNGEAHEMLENKINLAMYITVALQYSGGEDAAIRTEIASVTADDNALEIIKIGIPADWAAY